MRYERVQKTNTFNSWKETASYLGRGVRTVQRWEAELQLPVHRLGRSERSPIFAFKAELDGWLRKQAGRWSQPAESPGDPGATRPYSKALKHSGQICTTNQQSSAINSKAAGTHKDAGRASPKNGLPAARGQENQDKPKRALQKL